MKNWLIYFYDLDVSEIHQVKKKYTFKIASYEYMLFEYHHDPTLIDEIYDLSTNLLRYGIYCHQIVLNKQSKPLTYINGVPYILLKMYPELNKKIDLKDLLSYNNIPISNIQKLRRDDWKSLWIEKMDYFEYQVSQFGKKFPLIRESFSYFLGFVETGISFLNTVNFKNEKLVLSHKRLTSNHTLFDLYNPLNFIIDFRIRDVCEYFKEKFVHDANILDEIKNYLLTNHLSAGELQLFFIRMLYPSFYFDRYEMILNEEGDESVLIPILENVEKYEKLLKELYMFISLYVSLPNVEWIKKP